MTYACEELTFHQTSAEDGMKSWDFKIVAKKHPAFHDCAFTN